MSDILSASLVDLCTQIVGVDGILTDPDDRAGYSRDEYADEDLKCLPVAVVRPRTTAEVSEIVQLCNEKKIPITVRGSGTGLSGGCVPSADGFVLSTERLQESCEADRANQAITVGAGLSLQGLYEKVEAAGMFFPPHPGDESATVGGAVATNAGGSRAVKYGTIRDFVLGITVVLADGEILEIGRGVRKATSGYDLMDLIIGSEGTLAIITEVTLSLISPPGSLMTLVAPFETVTEAINAVPSILEAGIVPMAIEFIEHETLRCTERLIDKSWPPKDGTASCMFILDGASEDEVFARAEEVAEVLESAGALDILSATTAEQQRTILELRSTVYEALRPATAELLDICVPRSEIAGHVAFVASLEKKYNVQLPTYGHAADGNVHTHLLHHRIEDGVVGEEITDWKTLQSELRKAIYDDAVARNGVISGEHGIGIVKRGYLAEYASPRSLEIMRGIKRVFDPQGILNPGKVIPE